MNNKTKKIKSVKHKVGVFIEDEECLRVNDTDTLLNMYKTDDKLLKGIKVIVFDCTSEGGAGVGELLDFVYEFELVNVKELEVVNYKTFHDLHLNSMLCDERNQFETLILNFSVAMDVNTLETIRDCLTHKNCKVKKLKVFNLKNDAEDKKKLMWVIGMRKFQELEFDNSRITPDVETKLMSKEVKSLCLRNITIESDSFALYSLIQDGAGVLEELILHFKEADSLHELGAAAYQYTHFSDIMEELSKLFTTEGKSLRKLSIHSEIDINSKSMENIFVALRSEHCNLRELCLGDTSCSCPLETLFVSLFNDKCKLKCLRFMNNFKTIERYANMMEYMLPSVIANKGNNLTELELGCSYVETKYVEGMVYTKLFQKKSNAVLCERIIKNLSDPNCKLKKLTLVEVEEKQTVWNLLEVIKSESCLLEEVNLLVSDNVIVNVDVMQMTEALSRNHRITRLYVGPCDKKATNYSHQFSYLKEKIYYTLMRRDIDVFFSTDAL